MFEFLAQRKEELFEDFAPPQINGLTMLGKAIDECQEVFYQARTNNVYGIPESGEQDELVTATRLVPDERCTHVYALEMVDGSPAPDYYRID